MFKKVTKSDYKFLTGKLEFYDKYRCLPTKKKKVLLTISKINLLKLEGKNKSKFIDNFLSSYKGNI